MKSALTVIFIVISQIAFSQIDLKRELLNSDQIKTNWISLSETDSIFQSNEFLYLTRFQYGPNRYRGYAIWQNRENNFNLIWFQLDSSDYPPHTFSYVDFNGDKKADLLELAGGDEEFFTNVYVNNSKETYAPDNFILMYTNHHVYSTILDIDNDGKPEILDSESLPQYDSPFFYITQDQKKELSDKYDSMTKNNGYKNFTYGVPGSYKFHNLFLQDSIIIHQFVMDRFIDNTKIFKDHLSWRIKFLNQLKYDPRNDSKYIDNLIKYLKIKLK